MLREVKTFPRTISHHFLVLLLCYLARAQIKRLGDSHQMLGFSLVVKHYGTDKAKIEKEVDAFIKTLETVKS